MSYTEYWPWLESVAQPAMMLVVTGTSNPISWLVGDDCSRYPKAGISTKLGVGL